jgi:uncharacterized membrane protein (DUF4010 family)
MKRTILVSLLVCSFMLAQISLLPAIVAGQVGQSEKAPPIRTNATTVQAMIIHSELTGTASPGTIPAKSRVRVKNKMQSADKVRFNLDYQGRSGIISGWTTTIKVNEIKKYIKRD